MVTHTETTMLKEQSAIRQPTVRAQMVASIRQKTDGLVMALFADTNSRIVRGPTRR